MKYQFRFRNTPGNMLLLTLYANYTSYIGVINLVFTASMAGLLYASIRQGWKGWAIAACVGVLYFPLIQPIILYLRMKRNLSAVTEDTVISFSDKNILVEVGEKSEMHRWKDLHSVKKTPFQAVLYLGTRSGIVIPNDAMGDKKEEFLQYAAKQTGKKKM